MTAYRVMIFFCLRFIHISMFIQKLSIYSVRRVNKSTLMSDCSYLLKMPDLVATGERERVSIIKTVWSVDLQPNVFALFYLLLL